MKIERKYMAHYLNAAFGSGDASYTRLGSDLEEYSPELTANVEKKSNIKLWDKDTAGAYPAVREECYIEVVSYGGDTTGYQIPFNVHYTGVKTKGTFDPAAKKFTQA